MTPDRRQETHMTRTILSRLLAAAALCCALPSGVLAQDYPSRPVKVIVPFAPGSAADTTTRFLALRLGERLKQPVVIENKPGAGAAIGATALRQAAPDGYTLGNLVSANVVQPWLVKNPPFDIRNDFAPITMMYSGPMVLTVGSGVAAKNVAELIAFARANPGKVFVGSIGTGSATHLAAELLRQMAGVQIVNVPFKDAVEMHRAVAAGEVTFSFDTYASPKPLIEAGKLRVLAVTTREPVSQLPQVPPIAQTLPGYDIASWTGLGAPRDTPKAVLDRITTEVLAIMQTPEWRQLIASNGVEPGGMPPAQFAQRIAGDYDKFGRVITNAGIKPE